MKRHTVENKTDLSKVKQTNKHKTLHITGLHGLNKEIMSSNPTRCRGSFSVHFVRCRQEVLW